MVGFNIKVKSRLAVSVGNGLGVSVGLKVVGVDDGVSCPAGRGNLADLVAVTSGAAVGWRTAAGVAAAGLCTVGVAAVGLGSVGVIVGAAAVDCALSTVSPSSSTDWISGPSEIISTEEASDLPNLAPSPVRIIKAAMSIPVHPK